MTTILWFRSDLRLDDHRAVHSAAARGDAVLPVYVWSPEDEGRWPMGAAGRWWLHHSLESLDESLRARGSRLVLRRGRAADELMRIAEECDAVRLVCSRRLDPHGAKSDAALKRLLAQRGIEVECFNTSLLHEPSALRTKSGRPYQVFTPFWRALEASLDLGKPLSAPRRIAAPKRWPPSMRLADLALLPKFGWAGGIANVWSPGERGAGRRLEAFLHRALGGYDIARDRPDEEGSSRLSPHLRFGEISPQRVYRAVIDREAARGRNGLSRGAYAFLRELAWREFAHHLLHHFPHTPEKPLRTNFARFPWRRSGSDLCAWQRGRTGYPYVDAGMRQLWATGWMHNRVRMAVASFLVKHLLIDWRRGAEWFWDTLVDADLANNTLGWQWCAGCGADAAPYFRIFNPIAQGRKFDPHGAYVRQWVPELTDLPDRWIHEPWAAPPEVLDAAGVVPGQTYPRRVVEHLRGRERALAAFARIRNGGRE